MEELVKALRWCVLSNPCDGCPYYDQNGPTEKCATMNVAAADAIENLDYIAQTYIETVHELEEKSRWIPVTERLPEESEGLRWREDLMIRFTSVWCCDINTGIIEVRNRLQGIKTGIACLDQYTKDTNWHWSNAFWEPTHWMPIVPLPEPPKEEP